MDAGQTGVCVRAIDAGFRCRIGNDRMAAMTHPREDCGGKTLLQLLWDQLMEAYGDIMNWRPAYGVDPDKVDDEALHPEDVGDRERYKGVALGLAQAIAFITNPYAPNVDAVREEAVRRWEERSEAA